MGVCPRVFAGVGKQSRVRMKEDYSPKGAKTCSPELLAENRSRINMLNVLHTRNATHHLE